MNKARLAALIALAALSGCGGSRPPVTVASAGNAPEAAVTTSSTADTAGTASPSSSTTTAPEPPASTETTGPPPTAPSTTTTTAKPTTTTTRPPTTTTTRPAAHTVSVTPTPGPYGTTLSVRGDGCAGPGYGVTLSIHDPSGQEIPGDGGSTQPDGTWQLQEPFNGSQPSGNYTFTASCITATSSVVFSYAPATFRWNG